MLIIQALDDLPTHGIEKGDQFRLYIVDTHHHMGREGKHRNTPIGAYEFYTLLWFELRNMAKPLLDDDKLLFEPISVEAPSLPEKCFASKKSWKKMNHGWMIDRTIVFPYSDDYAKQDPNELSFKVSNDKIAGWTTRAPHSTRLIGFLRLDPTDAINFGVEALRAEITRCVRDYGLRGIKLHPIAQLFIDDIDSKANRIIFETAAINSIPIIIDTRNIRTVMNLKSLIDSIRRTNPSLVPQIILAHAGMSPSDERLYSVLDDPNIFCETSSIHGHDVPLLFDMARESMTSPWFRKIMFGTDYSFLSTQANEIILYLLSRDFQGSLSDIQSILAGNAMKLIQSPYTRVGVLHKKPYRITSTKSPSRSRKLLERGLISLLKNGTVDLQSIDYMIPGTEKWPTPQCLKNGGFNGVDFRSYLMSLKQNDGSLTQLWIRESPRQFLSCAILTEEELKIISEGAFTTQRFNSILIDSILDVSELVESPKMLVKRILNRILSNTPNKS